MSAAPPEYELSARGKKFHDMFLKIERLFKECRFNACDRRCITLLTHVDLGDYHAAHCHLLLACSTDQYLPHAQKAVELWENMYTMRPGGSFTGKYQPTETELEIQPIMLEQAGSLLQQAEEDKTAIEEDFKTQMDAYIEKHGHEPSSEDLVLAHLRSREAENESDEVRFWHAAS